MRGHGSTWDAVLHGRAIALLAVLGLPGAAAAQSWEYTFAPYLWAAGQSGDLSAVSGQPPVNVDLSFGDIFETLDFAAFFALHGNNGQWGFSADLGYVTTSDSATFPGPAFSGADVETETLFVTVTGEYLVSSSPRGRLWAGAGLRYWDVSTDITLGAGTLPGLTVGDGDSWVDPVIGVRGRNDLGRNSYFTGWAYLGGFGAGSDSMADLFAGIGYEFNDRTSGVFGYRYYEVDREEDEFVYDVSQQGPMFGIVFTF